MVVVFIGYKKSIVLYRNTYKFWNGLYNATNIVGMINWKRFYVLIRRTNIFVLLYYCISSTWALTYKKNIFLRIFNIQYIVTKFQVWLPNNFKTYTQQVFALNISIYIINTKIIKLKRACTLWFWPVNLISYWTVFNKGRINRFHESQRMFFVYSLDL